MAFRTRPSSAPVTATTGAVDDRWLHACLATAVARHGDFGLAHQDFRAEMQGRGAAIVHGADLALAIACDRGSSAAWSALVRCCTQPLLALLRGQGVVGEVADELLSDLWGELALPPPSGAARTRLGVYRGQGSLVGWLGVIALRHHFDRLRRRSIARVETGPPHQDLDDLASRRLDADPRRCAEDADVADRLRGALVRAFGGLPPRLALALAFRHGDGLDLQAIGRQLSVGVPRVSRMLQRGLADLIAAVRAEMGAAGADESIVGDPECVRVLTEYLANLSRPARREEVRPP